MPTLDLTSLRPALEHHQAEQVPGLVAVVREVDGDATATIALGEQTIGGPPVTERSLFRLASLRKPLTAVTVLQLVESGDLALNHGVDRWLPELADRQVLRRPDGPLDDTEPAARSLTVHDLLTFTAGLGAEWSDPPSPLLQALGEADLAVGPREAAIPGAEYVARLGALPLAHQPGHGWLYHTADVVLGELVARVAGRPFAEVLAERVFGPLGMSSAAGWVPAERLPDLTTSYCGVSMGDGAQVFDPAGPASSLVAEPPATAPVDVVMTAGDYATFLACLAGGGSPIITAGSVLDMTVDQLTPGQRQAAGDFLDPGTSWGYGLRVDLADAGQDGAPAWSRRGRYGWEGGLGTSAAVLPDEGIVAVLFTNRMMDGPFLPPVMQDFWTALHGALPAR